MSACPAWSNALAAMTNGPFVQDVGRAVANGPDPHPDEGARYLLTLSSNFLRDEGVNASVWAAFDFAIYDFEALDRIWRVAHQAAAAMPIAADHVLPRCARFVADRLPAVWGERGRETAVGRLQWQLAPTTRCLVLADRIDSLIGLMAADVTITGSKDPFALRRAAKDFLNCVIFPITRWEVAA